MLLPFRSRKQQQPDRVPGVEWFSLQILGCEYEIEAHELSNGNALEAECYRFRPHGWPGEPQRGWQPGLPGRL